MWLSTPGGGTRTHLRTRRGPRRGSWGCRERRSSRAARSRDAEAARTGRKADRWFQRGTKVLLALSGGWRLRNDCAGDELQTQLDAIWFTMGIRAGFWTLFGPSLLDVSLLQENLSWCCRDQNRGSRE